MMAKIDLNDLPQWSPWPSRLLGLTLWDMPSRTIEKVDQEYDKDKYARCLAYYSERSGVATPEAVKQFELGRDPATTVCVSHRNDLWLMSLGEARSRFYQLLVETMGHAIEESTIVIELGCGYGYNLWMLEQHFQNKRFWGGEYSTNAVRLASGLFHEDPRINVVQFNFYDPVYEIIEGVQQPITIFTSHAIEQLPESTLFFEALLRYRNRIKAVFHFEPVYELHDATLLGLMRRRYTEVNDYNRDLLSQLQQRSDFIRIVHTEADVFGLNPLNPASVIHWEFAS